MRAANSGGAKWHEYRTSPQAGVRFRDTSRSEEGLATMTIAALTLLALALLVLEYFTRIFSRALAGARAQVSPQRPVTADPAGASAEHPPETAGELFRASDHTPWMGAIPTRSSPALADVVPPGLSASAELHDAPASPARLSVLGSGFDSGPDRRERLPALELRRIGFRAPTVKRSEAERDPRAYMPPGMANAQAAPAPAVAAGRPDAPAAFPPAIAERPAPAATTPTQAALEAPPAPVTPEACAALELLQTVGRLEAAADELTRDPSLAAAGTALESLRDQAVDYDLDNLMAIANESHSRDAIACFREALTIANEMEQLSRRSARLKPSDCANRQLAQELAALRGRVAAAVRLGTSLAQRLQAGAGAMPREQGRYSGSGSLPIPS
jgi:hypothetical protein